jgi:hypothetical protein
MLEVNGLPQVHAYGDHILLTNNVNNANTVSSKKYFYV